MDSPGPGWLSHLRILFYGAIIAFVAVTAACELKTGLAFDAESGPTRQHEARDWNSVRSELPGALEKPLIFTIGALIIFEFGYQIGRRTAHAESEQRPSSEQSESTES